MLRCCHKLLQAFLLPYPSRFPSNTYSQTLTSTANFFQPSAWLAVSFCSLASALTSERASEFFMINYPFASFSISPARLSRVNLVMILSLKFESSRIPRDFVSAIYRNPGGNPRVAELRHIETSDPTQIHRQLQWLKYVALVVNTDLSRYRGKYLCTYL
jgi:hypothetical protein